VKPHIHHQGTKTTSGTSNPTPINGNRRVPNQRAGRIPLRNAPRYKSGIHSQTRNVVSVIEVPREETGSYGIADPGALLRETVFCGPLAGRSRPSDGRRAAGITRVLQTRTLQNLSLHRQSEACEVPKEGQQTRTASLSEPPGISPSVLCATGTRAGQTAGGGDGSPSSPERGGRVRPP